MDLTVALFRASFVAAVIGLFIFINSMSHGLFGNAQQGARIIFAPDEINRVEDPSATAGAQQVLVEQVFRIYRDTGVVLTRKGSTMPQARAFVEFLTSAPGRAILAKWGWDAR